MALFLVLYNISLYLIYIIHSSGTIKKAEHRRIDALKLWCWRRLLRVWKEIKPVCPKGNQPWIFTGDELILKLELQYFGHLMWRPDSLEKTLMLGKNEDKRRRQWQEMGWWDSITDSMGMNLSRLQEIVEDSQGHFYKS